MYYNNKWLLWSFYSNRRIVLSINKRFYRKVPGWKIYNHPSVDPSSSSDTHRQSLLQQWFDPSAFTLFAFQSVGRWHGNLVRQAHRFDWQYTLRSLLVSNKQQNDDSLQLGISDTKLIPLIFIEWSENVDDWKDHIAAFGIREPVVGLSCLHDWQSLVDQLGLSSEWKTTGFQLLQRNDASWLFKTEHKIYYGFHDSNRSASESIQLPSIHSDGQSLAQLVAQAQSLESASNRTMSNMEQVASNLQLNALDSWYDFRELEYQQRLAFAEKGPPILLQVPQTIFRYPRDALIHSNKKWIFVSDTFHHRIVVWEESSGNILGTIGCGVARFRDGDFTSCCFHQPSGMALNGDILYIADTENGCLRMADIESGQVETIFPESCRVDCNNNNMSRALEFCDIWRTPWKPPKNWDPTVSTNFGRPLSVVVKDKSISVLTVAPLAIWEFRVVDAHGKRRVEYLGKRGNDKHASWKNIWLEQHLEQFTNTPERISIDEATTQKIRQSNHIIRKPLGRLENLPPPWTLFGVRKQVADYDAFQYVYPYLRGRRIETEDCLYLIPGIARVCISINLPTGYVFAGKTLVHSNIQGPMVSTTPPLGIDDYKIPRGEKSRRKFEGLDEPQDLVLPEAPKMDPFSGVPIVIDMYTFPGSGFITVDLVVYLKKKESSVEDNTIFYDTIQLKAPIRVTKYGLETEYLYVTSRVEPPLPVYETISIDRLQKTTLENTKKAADK